MNPIKWPVGDGLIQWIESEKDYLQTKAFRTHHLNAMRNAKIETLQRVLDHINEQKAADHAHNLAALNRAPKNDSSN